MVDQGVPAQNIAVPIPELTDWMDGADLGTRGFLRPVHDDLRAETLVVNRSVFPAFAPGDADLISPLNIVWVAGAGNVYNTGCITVRDYRDYWYLPDWHACGRDDDFYNAMLNALETGKALMATAAVRQSDGTVVPHEGVLQCGDMMEHCVAVPGIGHTSGATAIVSAAAFHLFQTYERAEDVVAALKSCTEDVGEPGIDREFGLGVIDLHCAAAMLPVIER